MIKLYFAIAFKILFLQSYNLNNKLFFKTNTYDLCCIYIFLHQDNFDFCAVIIKKLSS